MSRLKQLARPVLVIELLDRLKTALADRYHQRRRGVDRLLLERFWSGGRSTIHDPR